MNAFLPQRRKGDAEKKTQATTVLLQQGLNKIANFKKLIYLEALMAISYMPRYYRFILLLLIIWLPQVAEGQWKKFQLLDETVIYKSIHVSADTFYVSGGKGLYGTFDAGNTWVKNDLGGYVVLNDINFFNSAVGVGVGGVGGNSATVMKTFDGGKTWTTTYVSNAGTVVREINDVEFIDKLNGYAVGRNKIVIKTTDGGNTWTSLNPIVEKNNTGIKMKAINQGYIVSPGYIQGFDGQSITGTKLVATSTVVDLKIIDDNNLIAASANRISKSSNGGSSWTHLSFLYSQINAMFVLNPQNIYVGTNNGVYLSTDGGVSWEIFKETVGKVITTIVINPNGKGLALGTYGDAYRTDNFGGASVPILSFDVAQKQYCNVSSLIFTATNTRANYSYQWLIGGQTVSTKAVDSIRFTSNSSSTLSLVCSNGVASDTLTKTFNVGIIEVKANAGTDIYACSNEPIQLAATGGAWGGNFTWSPSTGLSNPKINNPIATNINTIPYVLSVSYGACASRDTVTIFRNAPVARFDFQKMNVETAGWIAGIQMIDENIGYALGQQDLYKTTDGGFNWSKTFHMSTFSTGSYGDVEFISQDVGYFASDGLYKTTDGGKTAVRLSPNAIQIEDIEFLNPDVGYVATIASGGEFAGISRTEDGGQTWTEVYSQRGQIRKIKCFPSDRCVAIGYIETTAAYLTFLYSDDGITWNNAVYPGSISALADNADKYDISFVDDNTGYAVGGAYVWKTIDGGKSWKSDHQLTVKGGLDNQLVALPPSQITFIDSQNGFASVWSRGYLYRTVNGGACWENLGQMGNATLITRLFISKNKKIFIGANGPSFASQSIYQADFLLPIKKDQTIEFSIQSPKTIEDAPFKLGATASSTLPVTYEVSDESIASVSEDMLTIKNSGTVQITAKQDGNDSFNPASPVTRSLTIVKIPQAITFTMSSQKLVTDPPFDLEGMASSGLPVTYSTSDESVISISGNIATIKNAGTVQITAIQDGDNTFDAAVPVIVSLTITKVAQVITFTMASQKLATDPPFDLAGVASSGLPVTYSTSDKSVISISGNIATIKNAGTVQITATQDGDNTFDAAVPVIVSLTITKVPQVINFTMASQKLVTDSPFDLEGVASSGLPVIYLTSDESVISINGSIATIKNAGTVQITATQEGDDTFDIAAPVVQNIEVKKVQQNITFDLPSKQYGDPDFALDAKVDSGVPITYSIDNDAVADLFNNNMIRIKAAGNTNITATAQSTSIYYEASVTKNLEIKQETVTAIEASSSHRSTIYPNPADKIIRINLAESTNSTPTNIVLSDMIGRNLAETATTATEIPIDVSSFPSGVYFVKIIQENDINILRFIKR